jgi:hypothetical protein
MRGPFLRLPILAGLAVAIGCGGPPPAPEESLGPPVTVALKIVAAEDQPCGWQFIRLDASGRGSIPFANDAGKLLVSVTDGKARLDTNGDGAIDDKDAPAQNGETVKVRFRLGGRSAEYPVRIQGMNNGYLSLGGCLALEGTLDGCAIRLYDTNLNGTFGEAGKDTVEVAASADAGSPPDADDTPQKMGRFIAVKGRLVQATLVDGGSPLMYRSYTGEPALLTVKPSAPATSCTLQLLHGDGLMYARVSERNPVPLLPGTYRIQESRLDVSIEGERPSIVRRIGNALRGEFFPPGPRVVTLSGDADSSWGEEAVLTVRPGSQEIIPGPPFRLAFLASRWSGRRDRVEIQAAWLAGAAGERYTPSCSGPGNTSSTLTSLVRAGNREQKLSDLAYG